MPDPPQRLTSALPHAEQALATEPLSISVKVAAFRVRFYSGQRAGALRELEELVEEHPNRIVSQWYLANLQAEAGYFEQAMATLRRQMIMMGDNVADETALLGFIYGMTGQRDSAYAALARLDELEARGVYTSPTIRSWPYIGLGDFDEAFRWLDRAVEARDMWVTVMPTWPASGPIRSDPRYHDLLRRVGLAK